jgi:hypothetical protein
MDTYGYICNNSFVSSVPYQNVLADNNNNAGNNQFGFYIVLNTSTTYIFVVTTDSQMVTGNFSIIATGLASMIFSAINSSSENLI